MSYTVCCPTHSRGINRERAPYSNHFLTFIRHFLKHQWFKFGNYFSYFPQTTCKNKSNSCCAEWVPIFNFLYERNLPKVLITNGKEQFACKYHSCVKMGLRFYESITNQVCSWHFHSFNSVSLAADARRKPRQIAARGFEQKVKELQQAAEHWGLLQDPGQRHGRAPREQKHGPQRGGKLQVQC